LWLYSFFCSYVINVSKLKVGDCKFFRKIQKEGREDKEPIDRQAEFRGI